MGYTESHGPSRLCSGASFEARSLALDRRSTTSKNHESSRSLSSFVSGSSGSMDRSTGQIPSSSSISSSQPTSPQAASRTMKDAEKSMDGGAHTPPPFPSPDVVSGKASSQQDFKNAPLRSSPWRVAATPGVVHAAASRAARHDLARRLSQLAQLLTYEGSDGVEELMSSSQLQQLDRVMGGVSIPDPGKLGRGISLGSPARSEGDSVLGSPGSSLFRTRFSDLSASIQRERMADKEPEEELEEEETLPKKGMTAPQATKVMAEMTKLNDELTAVMNNLRARQEESEHIQGLLVERAERAAQRIIFLQKRITYLEQELHENDDELQHLRICLKAVEIQMPPHPDQELQRCIASFKDDYQALRRKRAQRASVASVVGFDEPGPEAPLV